MVYEGAEHADRPAAGAEPAVPTLVWTGPIEPHSGLETMLRALAELRETRHSVLLRVHGTAPAGAEGYLRHCRELVGKLFPEEPEAVVFEPADERLGAVHDRGSVIVFSGTQGARPRLVAEAMLSGRPVVTTDVGAAREVVGPTGLLVPADDPRALATACAALLGDDERRARLGNAGRLRARELYAVEPSATAFRGLYLELVSRWPQSEVAQGSPAARRPFGRTAEAWVAAESRLAAETRVAPEARVAADARAVLETRVEPAAEPPRRAPGRLADLHRTAAPARAEARTAVPVGAGAEEAGTG
ncbi:glycosyltransferase [Streptacidiphilus sp. PAMC 29251]